MGLVTTARSFVVQHGRRLYYLAMCVCSSFIATRSDGGVVLAWLMGALAVLQAGFLVDDVLQGRAVQRRAEPSDAGS